MPNPSAHCKAFWRFVCDQRDFSSARPSSQMSTCSCRQLASGSESSGTWRAEGSSGHPSQHSKAETAPAISGQVLEKPPVRSATSPGLTSQLSVKDTAKLRVEKFKVCIHFPRLNPILPSQILTLPFPTLLCLLSLGVCFKFLLLS